KYSLAVCSRFDCMSRRHASSSGKPRWQPSGTVRATPAVIRFSRSINPICPASRSKPPSELKKIGRSRFAKTAKNSRNRWAAPSTNLPSPAIHSVQPRPQAFGSPVATTKIIGSLRTFASARSSSLGSSLAAIETTGRQQSAAAVHHINLPIITLLRAEDRRETLLCLHRPPDATGTSGDLDPQDRGGGDPPLPVAQAWSRRPNAGAIEQGWRAPRGGPSYHELGARAAMEAARALRYHRLALSQGINSKGAGL